SGGSLGGAAAMGGQRGAQGMAKAGQGQSTVRTLGVAATEAAINLFVRIDEKGGPGQITVEIEDVEVHAADLEQAYPDNLLGDLGDLLQTTTRFVKFLAVASRLAPEDTEQRFAAASCGRPRGLIVREPAGLLGRLHRRLARGPGATGQQAQSEQARR